MGKATIKFQNTVRDGSSRFATVSDKITLFALTDVIDVVVTLSL